MKSACLSDGRTPPAPDEPAALEDGAPPVEGYASLKRDPDASGDGRVDRVPAQYLECDAGEGRVSTALAAAIAEGHYLLAFDAHKR